MRLNSGSTKVTHVCTYRRERNERLEITKTICAVLKKLTEKLIVDLHVFVWCYIGNLL